MSCGSMSPILLPSSYATQLINIKQIPHSLLTARGVDCAYGNHSCNRYGGAHCVDLGPLQARSGPRAGGAQMSVMNWIGLGLSLALGVYLMIALLLSEKFE